MGKIVVANDEYPFSLASILTFYYNPDRQPEADGDPVQDIIDLSGNARNAAQATSGSAPVLVKDFFNGRAVFSLNGSQWADINFGFNIQELVIFIRNTNITSGNFARIEGFFGSKDASHADVVFAADAGKPFLGFTTYLDVMQQYSPAIAGEKTEINGNEQVDFFPLDTMKVVATRTVSAMTDIAFEIGRERNVGGRGWTGNVGQIMGFTRKLTTLERLNLTRYLVQYYRFGSLLLNVVCEGNSLTEGYGATSLRHAYFSQLFYDFIGSAGNVTVSTGLQDGYTLSGSDTATMTARFATVVSARYRDFCRKNILIAWELTNTLALNSVSSTFNQNKAYSLLGKGAGFFVALGTCLYRDPASTAYPSGFNANVDTINAQLRADFSVPTQFDNVFLPTAGITYADMLIDFNQIAQLNSPTNMAIGGANSADGIHLNDTSYGYVADLVNDAISLF